MKRVMAFTIVFLLGVFIGTSLAVEVSLLGPQQYTRTKGKPNLYTDTFPGVEGAEGTLYVWNGDENGKHRISSAIIEVNGVRVLGPSDFSQKVDHLGVPVTLSESNTISVELRSKPGSYLAVQVLTDMEAEAAAVIGPEGGTITVTYPQSELVGAQIYVPPGALPEDTIITTNEGGFSSHPTAGTVSAGPIINFGPEGTLFSADVYLALPYEDNDHDGVVDFSDIPEDQVSALTFNTNTGQWEGLNIVSRDFITQVPDSNGKSLSCQRVANIGSVTTRFIRALYLRVIRSVRHSNFIQ